MPSPLIELLAKELAVPFTLDSASRERTSRAIIASGELEFGRIIRDAGSDFLALRTPMVRSLGVGSGLTHFAISGTGVPAEFLSRTRSLGALASLIVSAFDALIDSGEPVPALLSGDSSGKPAPITGSKAAAVSKLIELYFQRLTELPQERVGIRLLIDRSIRRMYEAEIGSTRAGPVPRHIWWRKNVLPFVVMAIPAWLVSQCYDVVLVRRHLRWLCRLGEFLGWVDDCVDYENDRLSGAANRVDARLSTMTDQTLVRKIAVMGRRVLSDWDHQNPRSEVRNVFAVVVTSWIENPPAPPVS